MIVATAVLASTSVFAAALPASRTTLVFVCSRAWQTSSGQLLSLAPPMTVSSRGMFHRMPLRWVVLVLSMGAV